MRSGITRRWLRGSLLITVLLVLLAEGTAIFGFVVALLIILFLG